VDELVIPGRAESAAVYGFELGIEE